MIFLEGRAGVTTGSESSADQLARRFNLGCLIALLPRAERAVALQELIDVDPRFFHLGYDHPPPVIESAVADGTPEVRRAVARATGTEDAQERLFAMDQPDIDAALADNPYLPYDLACRLRLRRPAVVASGTAYNADHHSRALCSGNADLVAAALIDRRTASWARPLPPTVWATGWRTVRLASGVERVRAVLAALPADLAPAALDEATRQIAEACAEADPEPFLSTAEDRVIGTAAFLRRLSAVRERTDQRLGEQILGEPYDIDWSLVSAAGLAGRMPKMAVQLLRHHQECPPDVEYVLRTGRPAPRHLKQGSLIPNANQATNLATSPPPHHPAPYAPPPPNPGPLAVDDPLAVLATTPVDRDLTIDHLWGALELKLLTGDAVVANARPAVMVSCYAGQTSSFFAHATRPGSGQGRLNAALVAHLAHWAAAGPPAPGLWRAVSALLRTWPGTLPELLEAAAAGRGSQSDR
ncbi:hypothetical protein GCM10009839_77550 [Catenulispora yoronensis]|uniref:Uncharacterized protein n=1 Tax=Catenulispora yoronensis TaxID=450799 RepID=A0ABN2VFN3_9ACTN